MTDKERLTAMETQIKIFRWICGSLIMVVFLSLSSLSSWIYAQGNEVAKLQNQSKTQIEEVQRLNNQRDTLWGKIDDNRVKVISVKSDLKYTNKTLKEIKELLHRVHKIE